MTPERLRVLFLCTGNSARSQMAEAILRHLSRGSVEVESAGSHPRPEIHRMAREAVRKLAGLEMEGQRPKSIADLGDRSFDYLITVCDRAADVCPAFPGAPETIHWSLEDPAEAAGSELDRRRAFENSARDIMARIRLWLSLPAVAARTGAPCG